MKNHQSRPNKNSYTAKSKPERSLYGDFLNRPAEEIDDTFDEKNETSNSSDTIKDLSFLKNKQNISPKTKVRPNKKEPYKSIETQIKENLKSILFYTIITSIITTCVGIVWQQNRELGEISITLKTLEEDMGSIQGKYQTSDIGQFDTIRIITEITKDLEFVKIRLQKLESKINI